MELAQGNVAHRILYCFVVCFCLQLLNCGYVKGSVSRGLGEEDGNYQIHEPWYEWPLEDTIEIIQRVKESNNHRMNSSRLFRSFEVQSHILPQNLESFSNLKKRYLDDVEVNKYIQSALLPPLNYEETIYTQFRFTPPALDFKEAALCVSVVKQIEMKNLLLEEVTLLGITTETPNFIAGPISNKVLQPGQSITLDVLFFPRVLDHVEDFLTVQTTAGHYSFFVQGTGILNPYLLTPLVDKHIAADTTYAPSIEVFNPTSETLQIVKLFTTGGFLNLPFQGDTPIEFWQVNPYETRSIIRLNFLSPNPNSYRGMVNIATHDKFVITLPVEISVHLGEIVSIPQEIDFDVHPHYKDSITREISLLNSQTYSVLVTSIQTSRDDPYTKITFSPVLLSPGTTTIVATITHISQVKGPFRGSLRIYTNDTNPHFAEILVPYYGKSVWGSIQYNQRDTSFLLKQFPTLETRIIPLVHHFPVPIKVYSAEITSEAFRVMSCNTGEVVFPNTPWSGISVQFSGSPPLESSNVLTLATNLTTLRIPLIAYHGRLEFSVLEQLDPTRVDFGILALNEVSLRVVNVSNPNPVHIQVNAISISLSRLQVRLEGIYDAQGKRKDNSDIHGTQFTLESMHHALFILQVICSAEEMGLGFLTFQYNEKLNLEIPVSYHSMKGTLNLLPSQIQFSPSFPGRVLQKAISVKSTYSKPVYIQSIISSDPRVIPITLNTTIPPHKRMDIATVFFNPALGPPDENYMVSLSTQVLSPSPEDTYALQIDRRIINHRENIWNRITADGSDVVQGTITINTDVISGHTITFKAPLSRPSIIRQSSYDFELTQIGSTSEMMVPVVNPSDQPLQVQLYSINPPDEFLLPAESEQPYFLPPRSSSAIGPIYFLPQYFHKTNMSLYLKNNLTVLEMVAVHGQGGSGLFVFASSNQTESQRSSNTPLLLDSLTFVLQPSDMEQCLDEENPQLTVTKDFLGMNKGNLAVHVYGLSINYGGCRDYGFRVSPCGPFTLQPNEEITLSVTFSPDFSSSIVKRSLIVSTSQGDISFPLEGELPFDWLSVCADSQPLSPLQQSLRRCFIALCIIILIGFCVYLIREAYIVHPPLDDLEQADKREWSVASPVLLPPTFFQLQKLEVPNEEHFARDIDAFVASLPVKPPKKRKVKKEPKKAASLPTEALVPVEPKSKEEPVIPPVIEETMSSPPVKDKVPNSPDNKPPVHSVPKEKQTPEKVDFLPVSTPPLVKENPHKNIISPKEISKPENDTKEIPKIITTVKDDTTKTMTAVKEDTAKVITAVKEATAVQSVVASSEQKVRKGKELPGKRSPQRKEEIRSRSTPGSPTVRRADRKPARRGDKRKPKKEKVWEPKKILSRPKVFPDEQKIKSDLEAIISDDYSPNHTPPRRPYPWESPIGIGMLRSDHDLLVDENEMEENNAAGVIGQITPPRGPPTTTLPSLDSLFPLNPRIFSQSDSLFGVISPPNQNRSASSDNVSTSSQNAKQFSGVYQLF